MGSCSSGQRGLTVNQLALPSVVRIHYFPLIFFCFYNCGSSSIGRASAFQAEGRGFETRLPL